MKKLLLFLISILVCTIGMAQAQNMGKASQQNGIHMIGNNDGGGESLPVFSTGNNTYPDVMNLWVLPSTGGTSGNTRAPGNTWRYQRTEYLIRASEIAASGFPSGVTVDGIGWLIGTAGVGTQTGTLNIWLMNTSDVTYNLGTTWTVAGFTQVSTNPTFTVPIAAGSYTVPFTGGSTFTYTGGGVYVAWEFSNPSGAIGTTAVVHLCNLNLTNGLYGQRNATAMPTTLVGSNWRPATTFINNLYTDVLQVTNIYVQEKTPVPYGVPTTPSARVFNVSASPETFNVTMTIKDPTNTITRYTDTQTVTALAGGAAQVVTFAPWTASVQEEANVTVTVPAGTGEDFFPNNTMTIPMNINNNLYGYCYTLNPSTGYGFTYNGVGGIFLNKFHMNGQGSIPSANLFIYNYAANTGNNIFAVVLNSAGTIVAQTAPYAIQSTDLGTNKNFSFPTIPVFTDEDFYVGLAQPTGGTVQWYPMGCMVDAPYRANTFYYLSGTTGGTPIIQGTDYKFMIEAVVGPPSLLAHDVGTLSIDMSQVVTLGTSNPMATVKNFGANTETFTVTMTIGAYTSTKTVNLLPSGNSTQVTFDPWTNALGNYTVNVCTSIASDEDPTNDCQIKAVKVLDLNKTVYGYNAFPAGGTDPEGPMTFNLATPGNLTSLADQSLLNFVAGGTWANGEWYGTEYNTVAPYNLIKINTVTGARTVVGDMGVNMNGLSYNTATGVMYGVGYNSVSLASELYTINLGTGAATLVGSTPGVLLINLAINNAGQCYSIDINLDNFGSVNLATGAFSVIGSLGIAASYAQDLEFDRDANELYWAAYTSIGELRWVDVTNGSSMSVGTFEGGAEVTGFAIPYTWPVLITGTLTDPLNNFPPSTGLSILAQVHCNPAVVGTLQNGGVTYNPLTGIYNIHTFPGYTLLPGDLVDVFFYDGTNSRSVTLTVTPTLPVIHNVQILHNWFAPLDYTDWITVDIPPNSTLLIHYNNVQWPYHEVGGVWGGCGNTDVQQWNGTSWIAYRHWNWNPDSTIREITNPDPYWHKKRIHCDDHFGFVLDFTIVPSTGNTTVSNPETFAAINLGGRDGFACEFGNIVAPTHTFIYQEGAQLMNFASRLGTDGVQNLTIQFESYANDFWGDMELMIDLTSVTQPGTLELYIPDATIPLTTATINPGDLHASFNPGGILAPGIHTMTLSATGGLSMGIDCFNFVSNTGAPASTTLNVFAFLEGLYAGGGLMNQAWDENGPHFPAGIADQIEIELHNDVDYPTLEYTTGLIDLTTAGQASVSIPAAYSGSYWITVKHRNHILTVSANPVSFAVSPVSYNFTTAASQAYGDNQKDEGDGNFAIWAGDINQDGIVDSGDMNAADNAGTYIIFVGYAPEDVNGDGIADSGDMNIVDNNSTAVIMSYTP